MAEYISRSYIRKMAMLEMAYAMETGTDSAVVLRMIDDAPGADVAQVVRCGECRKFIRDTGLDTGKDVGLCDGKMLGLVRPTDYCSFGEPLHNDEEGESHVDGDT